MEIFNIFFKGFSYLNANYSSRFGEQCSTYIKMAKKSTKNGATLQSFLKFCQQHKAYIVGCVIGKIPQTTPFTTPRFHNGRKQIKMNTIKDEAIHNPANFCKDSSLFFMLDWLK